MKWNDEDTQNIECDRTMLLNVPEDQIPDTIGVHIAKYVDPNQEIKGILDPFQLNIYEGLDNYETSTPVSYQADRIVCREQNLFLRMLNFIPSLFGTYINSSHYVTYVKGKTGEWMRISDESVKTVSSKEVKERAKTEAVIVSCSRV